jgi:DNA excision repair protein ERCC-4
MNDYPHHISIIADDREPKNDVLKYLSARPDIIVTVKRLPIGDYLADNRLIIERKTIRDFAISIIDGRLFKQAAHLAGSRHRSVLILEGTGNDLVQTGIQRHALQGALISISLVFGIPVLLSFIQNKRI